MICIDVLPGFLWWARHAERITAALVVGAFLGSLCAAFYLRLRCARSPGVS